MSGSHEYHPHEIIVHPHTADSPTEEFMCLRGTIPHHLDDHFSKLEDLAGTGEVDSMGG